jgi:hypothetical protein
MSRIALIQSRQNHSVRRASPSPRARESIFRSVKDLVSAIGRFIDAYNDC